jgi:hypothetical protein
MGSGKSYALGVLLENALLQRPRLIRQSRPMCVLAFNYRRNPDSRFEYGGFARPNSDAAQVAQLRAQYGAEPAAVARVNVFAYEPELGRPNREKDYQGLSAYPIQFRSSELGAEHWEILMKPPATQAEYMHVVRDIIRQLFYAGQLTLKNLERHIATDSRFTQAQRQRAANRLSFAQRWINDERTYEWTDVLQEGVLNVFDLRTQTLDAGEALKLCLVLTDIARRTHNGVNKLIVFDEAHEYVDNRELVGELENALTQIRHDGLSFVLASQFPERIPERIFKYLLTRFIFKLPTGTAINYLRRSAPNLTALAPQQVSNLDLEQGMGFIQSDDDCSDPLLRTPQLIAIRPRCSQHGGATVRQLDPDAEKPVAVKADDDQTLGELCTELGISLQRLLRLLQWPDNGTVVTGMKLRTARAAVAGKKQQPAKSA